MFTVSRAARQAASRVAASAMKVSRAAGPLAPLTRNTLRAVFPPRCPCRSYASSTPPTADVEAAESKVAAGIAELVKNTTHDGSREGGRWALVGGRTALERSFRFKNFTKTWDFMTAVALQCKLKNHHPEWSNVYNTVFVRWTTHSAPTPGLTTKDIEMARICDALGKAFGEQADEAKPAAAAATDVGPTCKMQSLADTAKGITGGDCCNHKA